MIKKYLDLVLSGHFITKEEAIELIKNENKKDFYEAANTIRKHFMADSFEMCSIINAKSGHCPENCKYCAQSAHYKVKIKNYELIDKTTALKIAKENDSYGVKKISLVTSGRSVSNKDLDKLKNIYTDINNNTKLETCASMGFLTAEKAEKLKKMGVSNYHCNLETARSFFAEVCTTHTYDQKTETIKIAQKAGLKVCSGGIIGLGESMEQRIEMALDLRKLGIKSIPINILTPVEGTPFFMNTALSKSEIIDTIAIFRFINPDAKIRFAGGRIKLGDEQRTALNAGINAAIVGNYLTTSGNSIAEDLVLFREEGFSL